MWRALVKTGGDNFLHGLVPDGRCVEFALDDDAPAAMHGNDIGALIAGRLCQVSVPSGLTKALRTKLLIADPACNVREIGNRMLWFFTRSGAFDRRKLRRAESAE